MTDVTDKNFCKELLGLIRARHALGSSGGMPRRPQSKCQSLERSLLKYLVSDKTFCQNIKIWKVFCKISRSATKQFAKKSKSGKYSAKISWSAKKHFVKISKSGKYSAKYLGQQQNILPSYQTLERSVPKYLVSNKTNCQDIKV